MVLSIVLTIDKKCYLEMYLKNSGLGNKHGSLNDSQMRSKPLV